MNKIIQIPDEHKQICQEFIALARKLGLRSLQGHFQTDDGWDAKIQFNWEQGRHGVPNQINIQSQFWTATSEMENREGSRTRPTLRPRQRSRMSEANARSGDGREPLISGRRDLHIQRATA